MEKVAHILQSLSIDEAFFYQFAVLMVIFFALHFLFFERLGEVIRLREDKTTRLNNSAEKKLIEGERLAALYREKVNKAKQKSQEIFNRHKKTILEEGEKSLKEEKKEIALGFKGQEEEIKKELAKLEEMSLKKVDSLAKELTEKIIQ